MNKIAFLGLGVMGFPMAGHLCAKEYDVTVYNRTRQKADSWCEVFKGKAATTPKEAAQGQDFVMACVGNDNDLREVCLGPDGAFKGMKPGAIFVDHTTVSAKVTQELYLIAKDMGIGFIDAPVSGGQAGAQNGALSVMCGGERGAYEKAYPVIMAYAHICRHIGKSGSGQVTKMMNQICIAGILQGLSEALAFGQKAGLNGEKVIEVISQGAAGSWQMQNRSKTMLENKFDFGFAVDLMRKDLGICLDTANDIGASLPLSALIDQFYKDIQRQGGGRLDTSSLILRLA